MQKQPTHAVREGTSADRALEFMSNRGIVRLRELKAEGISGMTVARLVRAGRVIHLARGLYKLADVEIEAGHTLAEAAKLVPKGVVCLISALSRHDLTLQMPAFVWVAINGHTRLPSHRYPPMRFVRFGGEALAMGVDEHCIEGVTVKITSPAKTIADCFKFRNKIGVDIPISAMREALRQRRCTPAEIMEMAQPLRVANVVRPYLEAMTADET